MWQKYSVRISEGTITIGSSPQELLDPTCSFCLFIIKKLETLLPTNMTEVTSVVKINKQTDRQFLINALPSTPCRKLWWSSWRRSVTSYPVATQSSVKILWPNTAKRLSSSSCRLLLLTQYAPCCTCAYSRRKPFQVGPVCLYVTSHHKDKELVQPVVATEHSDSSREPPCLRVWLVPHAGRAESSPSGSQFHPTRNLLLPPVCVFPSPQRHPQGLSESATHVRNPSPADSGSWTFFISTQCEVFTKVYGSRLHEMLGQQMEGTYACEV